ncbi:MAG: hypothetical protein MK208_06805, partial [Shimia sp.]|uniref:hypothetical protein n=1 Tax=Shimia sp. TaxID=1954381 RepID=UPI0025EA6B50
LLVHAAFGSKNFDDGQLNLGRLASLGLYSGSVRGMHSFPHSFPQDHSSVIQKSDTSIPLVRRQEQKDRSG